MKLITLIAGVGIILIACLAIGPCVGIGGFGPENTVKATVLSKHVDVEGKDSITSYMVVSDNGTFEVDNGFLLDVWNADEVYGQIQAGHKYIFTTKGKRYTNMFMQHYPFITSFQEVK